METETLHPREAQMTTEPLSEKVLRAFWGTEAHWHSSTWMDASKGSWDDALAAAIAADREEQEQKVCNGIYRLDTYECERDSEFGPVVVHLSDTIYCPRCGHRIEVKERT